jgi:hypothetical protein
VTKLLLLGRDAVQSEQQDKSEKPGFLLRCHPPDFPVCEQPKPRDLLRSA